MRYGYHFIYSSCDCDNEELADLDGKSFDRLDEAIQFLLSHDGNDIFIMVWAERLNEEGIIVDSACVDEFNSATYLNYLG